MAQIRQEINILDSVLSGAGVSCLERVQLDTTKYSGTVSFYLEVVAKASAARVVTLFDAASNAITTATTDSSNVYKIYRSAAFSVVSATTNYFVHVANDGTDLLVKSARIVVIQSGSTITDTETQIEIGNYNTGRTAEAATALTNPKYWKYTAANWDGTKTFYAEAVYDSGSMDTVTVALETTTDILAPSWSTAVTIASAVETTVPTRTRVSFTPTDGNWYRITSFNGSMDNHDIYRAGIVVGQITSSSTEVTDDSYSESNQDTDEALEQNAAGKYYKYGQSFTSTGGILSSVQFYIKKTGSPAGTVSAVLYAHTGTYGTSSKPTGTALATSGTISASTLSTSYELKTFSFTGENKVNLVSGTYYCIAIEYQSGSSGNTVVVGTDRSSPSHSGNYFYMNGSSPGTWTSNSAADTAFYVKVIQEGFTKLEPQYLLANTLFAAGTALQVFPTDWDSTEWDGVTNTYYFQAEAADGSTSDVTLEQADGGGTVTNSTLTNIDNAQISAALTMPASENLDTKATTNAGDVAAVRILVATVVSSATTLTPSVNDAITVSEGVTMEIRVTPSVFEAITVSENVDVLRAGARDVSVSDAITVTESVTISVQVTPSVFDAVTVAEDFSAAVITNVSVSESVTVTDVPTVEVRVTPSVFDAVTVSEDVTMRMISYISVFDAVTVAEDIAKVIASETLVSDAITVSEDVSIRVNALPVVSDTVTITEDVTVQLTSYVSVSDLVTVTDVPTTVVISMPSVSDTVSVSEDFSAAVITNVSVFDAVSVAEDVAFRLDIPLSVSELVTVLENVDNKITVEISVSDTASITEAITAGVGADPVSASTSDAITVTEAVTLSVVNYPSVSDVVTLSEDVNIVVFNLLVVVSDVVSVTENVVNEIRVTPSVFDAVAVVEDFTSDVRSYLSVNDTVSVAENFAATLQTESAILISVSDTVSVEDVCEYFDDLVAVGEAVTVSVTVDQILPSVSDTVTVTESVSITIPVVVSVSDAVGVSESVSMQVGVAVSVFDLITITESLDVRVPALFVDVSDSVTVAEDVSLFYSLISFSTYDAITVTDSYAYVITEEFVPVGDANLPYTPSGQYTPPTYIGLDEDFEMPNKIVSPFL